MENQISDETYESVGIQNCGNSCYMNSAIQLLLSIKEFREYILKYQNTDNIVISTLRSIFQDVERCRVSKQCFTVSRDIIISKYEFLFNQFPLKGENFGIQGDSQEFLSFLIDHLQTCNKSLTNIMFFKYITKTYCYKKGENHPNILDNEGDDMCIFQVRIQEKEHKKKSIQKLLEKEIKNPELLGKSESLEKCRSKKLNSYKENDIKLNKKHKYFLIQILRFTYSRELRGIKFLDNNIHIDKYLEINGYTYVLSGIILRRGGNNSGHYVYASYKNGKLFRIYDDESVYSEIKYGFDVEKHSYVLLYTRSKLKRTKRKNKNVEEKKVVKKKNHILEQLLKNKEIAELFKNLDNNNILKLFKNKNILKLLNQINYQLLEQEEKNKGVNKNKRFDQEEENYQLALKLQQEENKK
jgi:uncharacterized UBP type Zn finger protein